MGCSLVHPERPDMRGVAASVRFETVEVHVTSALFSSGHRWAIRFLLIFDRKSTLSTISLSFYVMVEILNLLIVFGMEKGNGT